MGKQTLSSFDMNLLLAWILFAAAIPQSAQAACTLNCRNGGYLNEAACACICQDAYAGVDCTTLTCAIQADPIDCDPLLFPQSDCAINEALRGLCPYLCGLCPLQPPTTTTPSHCSITCKNLGVLDETVCVCQCPTTYTGSDCGTALCNELDPVECMELFDPTYCTMSDVKALCPFMCEACNSSSTTTTPTTTKTTTTPATTVTTTAATTRAACSITCLNQGVADPTTCTCNCLDGFTGAQCGTALCNMPDPVDCSQIFTAVDCTLDPQLPPYCPFLCGICNATTTPPLPVCGGLECDNGGTLDAVACVCSCRTQFTGQRCETVDCLQAVDDASCAALLPQKSVICPDPQFTALCPFMCDLCVATTTATTTNCANLPCQHEGVADPASCSCICLPNFSGAFCETRICLNEVDAIDCADIDPAVFCSDQQVQDFCPILCGQCPPVTTTPAATTTSCVDIPCQHEGNADPSTCSCICLPNFTGTLCENRICLNEADPVECADIDPVAFCSDQQVQDLCPILCSLCRKSRVVTMIRCTTLFQAQL